jgi:hypothetical protein
MGGFIRRTIRNLDKAFDTFRTDFCPHPDRRGIVNQRWNGADMARNLEFGAPLLRAAPVQSEAYSTQGCRVGSRNPGTFINNDVFAVEERRGLPGTSECRTQGVLELRGTEFTGVARQHTQIIRTHRVRAACDHFL